MPPPTPLLTQTNKYCWSEKTAQGWESTINTRKSGRSSTESGQKAKQESWAKNEKAVVVDSVAVDLREVPPIQAPEKVPTRSKPRNVYGPENFKYEQPVHGGHFPKLVLRSWEWFEKKHTKVQVERNDPFPEERKASRAERQALLQAGWLYRRRKRSRGWRGVLQGWGVHTTTTSTLRRTAAQACATITKTIWDKRKG